MRKLIAVILTLFTVAFFAGCLELATAAPPAPPNPVMATQAEMEAGTETKARTAIAIACSAGYFCISR
jgi:hypothetical protein